MTYAAKTTVTAERSRAELETLLQKHGATQRGIMVDDADPESSKAVILFQLDKKTFRLEVTLPTASEIWRDFKRPLPRGFRRWTHTQRDTWVTKEVQQRSRERWRAILLVVKAKLEFIALGASTAEREFFGDLVLPDGRRLYAVVHPQLDAPAAPGAATPPILLPPSHKEPT